nr:hypothetical protein [Aquabacterium sp. A08]
MRFICRVVTKEVRLLLDTRRRLFVPAFNAAMLKQLDQYPDWADRIESFVARFGRLQDTAGDKLLPMLLAALGERIASVSDNLDRAERLGLIPSADQWFAMRSLRNQMVHEYVEDPEILWGALQAAHDFSVPLAQTAEGMVIEIERRGWL